MGFQVLGELDRRAVLSAVVAAVGSLALASCSSNLSRFDMPTFGLAKSESDGSSAVTLNGSARMAPTNSGRYLDEETAPAELERGRNSDLAPGGVQSIEQRNSYMPPQTAVPEVRGSRYDSIGRQSLGRVERTQEQLAPVTTYQQPPMRPIDEQKRSFLPSEPPGYAYVPPGDATQPSVEPVPHGMKPLRQAALNREETRSAARSATRSEPKKQTIRAPQPAEDTVENGRSAQSGKLDEVEVQSGDTLHAIARRHGLSVPQMMEANNLADSNIAAGQKLRLPKAERDVAKAAPTVAEAESATKRSQQRSSGTYTVAPGDDFQTIAQNAGVEAAELAEINGITDTSAIRPGEVLILPADANANSTAQTRTAAAAAAVDNVSGDANDEDPKQRIHKVKTVKMTSLPEPATNDTDTSGSEEKADAADTVVSARPGKERPITGFRWPVEGRIIEKFGVRPDGTNNDGINLAVPSGTKVKAAEDGIVAYVGSELKDYGNLVLIRHSDGWVSAYAHNDQILVQRGDQVKRGQDIARAGNSGSVEQPQVHFELRKGSKPVDPIQYMSGS